MDDVFFDMQERVLSIQNERLTRDFTKEEILVNLNNMHPTKAPSADGFPVIFFKKFWHIVGEATVKLCLDVLNNGASLGSLNHTLIALVPKVKDPKEIGNYRPISLYCVIYKLILKTIANRLKCFLLELISPKQSAFIPETYILDNVLVSFETVHKLKATREGKHAFMALKVDISKAYDIVSWVFLKVVTKNMGFHQR